MTAIVDMWDSTDIKKLEMLLGITGDKPKLYSFNLLHNNGKNIGFADCLNKFPQKPDPEDHVIDDNLIVCITNTVSRSMKHQTN